MPRCIRRWAFAGFVAAVLGVACDAPTGPSRVVLGWSKVRQTAAYRQVEAGFRSADGTILGGRLCLPPQEGRYAAAVFHFGSDRWTAPSCERMGGWTVIGIAAFVYDKRGVGRSGGNCCPFRDEGYFEKLGDDVVAGARMLSTWPEIDPARLGAYGFSQGGWIVPVAATRAPDLVRWTIIGSGPVVTLGEELLYSELSGDDSCRRSSLTEAELEARLDAAGKSGFDPEPYLRRMRNPGLWIYGGLDFSIPVERSVRNLGRIRDAEGAPFTIVTVPGISHAWLVNGGPCDAQGVRWDDYTVIGPWLRGIGVTR